MTTVVLNDELVNQAIKTGHYQSAEEAIEVILFNYIQTHKQQKITFDSLCVNLNRDDEEIDSLFQRSKDVGVGVMLDAEEYEAIQEKIEVLLDIDTALRQLSAGQGIEHSKAKERVLSHLAGK